MSETAATLNSNTEETGRRLLPITRSVHVRDVPFATWRQARQNALLSGMKFKDYVTRLLAEGPVFPSEN